MTTSRPINDVNRQRYLREMGVALYFPRQPLAGAAPSRRYHGGPAGRDVSQHLPRDPEPTVSQSTEPPSQRPAGQPPSGPGSAAGHLDGPGGLREQLREPERAPVGSVPASTGTERSAEQSMERSSGQGPAEPAEGASCRFRFSWYLPDERLAVIAAHESQRLPREQHDVLHRIVAALNPRYRALPLQPTVVQWPLDPSLPGSVDDARQMVRAFLRRNFTRTVPRCVLLLMDEAPLWLFPADAEPEARRELVPLRHPEWDALFLRVPSLDRMQRDRACKRPAWDAMQQLIGPLED